MGFLGKRGRLWAWVGFLALSIYAPVTAGLVGGDDWLLSVTVATMLGVVIIADDAERRKARAGSTRLPDEG